MVKFFKLSLTKNLNINLIKKKKGFISEKEFINGCLSDKLLYQMLTSDYSENF